MSKKKTAFRVGRVSVYCRGRTWYLCYYQHGRRHRPRVGSHRQAARKLAAEINAQLENDAPAVLNFEPIAIPELRRRWLDHHEHVLRSSVATISRYRAASNHLLAFVSKFEPVRAVSHFQARHAQSFVVYLRGKQVAPNGHAHARRRPLRDKGVKFILEVCRALFNFAAKQRHLGPYVRNPFSEIEIDRIPIEDAKPFVGFTVDQERTFLESCDDWQFPIFLTLLMTGLRPGELSHLLLPDDLDLKEAWLWVRNKPDLGWKVKTRNERRIPLVPELVTVLRRMVGQRSTGPAFLRRRFCDGDAPILDGYSTVGLQSLLARRCAEAEAASDEPLDRSKRLAIARTVWRDAGMIKTESIRTEFMRLTKRMGMAEVTAPKMLRHLFATCLQDANVDPLIRNQLMGHAPERLFSGGGGLGMTGVYTHTRPEVMKEQLINALRGRPAIEVAVAWTAKRANFRAVG